MRESLAKAPARGSDALPCCLAACLRTFKGNTALLFRLRCAKLQNEPLELSEDPPCCSVGTRKKCWIFPFEESAHQQEKNAVLLASYFEITLTRVESMQKPVNVFVYGIQDRQERLQKGNW